MHVISDLDGVVAELVGEPLAEIVRREFGVELPLITSYDISSILGVPYNELKTRVYDSPQFIMAQKPIPGSKQGLEYFEGLGMTVALITARNYMVWGYTMDWLDLHEYKRYGVAFISPEARPDFIRRKKPHVYIDDNKDTILSVYKYVRGLCFLLDYPYNQGELPTTVWRARDWDEIIEVMQEVEDVYKEKGSIWKHQERSFHSMV